MAALLLTALVAVWSPEMVVRDYIQVNYPWPEVHLQVISGNGQQTIPYPDSIKITSGSIPGRVTFKLSSQSGESTYVEANVEAFDWVISNRRAMLKGEAINSEDIYKTMININNIPKGAISSETSCLGKVLTASIGVNRPITDNLLANAAIVRKGDEVRILIETEKFKITSRGIAKEDGSDGRYIKVFCPSTNKLITGKITGAHSVTVAN
ncbi:MAG: flagellar basal body P-ring formation chaperone FlgA [Candidatus Magnetominusculus sp. LBB02]|nr:flagellar basal body P-ring formation chaperone FlgA [Candidatus Magnetominusculus sp. LBB02]